MSALRRCCGRPCPCKSGIASRRASMRLLVRNINRETHGAFIIAHDTSLYRARRRNRSFGGRLFKPTRTPPKIAGVGGAWCRAHAGSARAFPLLRLGSCFFCLLLRGCLLCLLFVSLLPLAVVAVSARCAVAVRACRRWSCVLCLVGLFRRGACFRAVGFGRRRCRCAGVLVCGFRCCRLRCRRRRFCVRALRRVCCRCPCRRGRRCRLASFLLACCRRACFACRGCGGLPSVFARCLLGVEVACARRLRSAGFFLCEEIQTP